MFITRGDRRIKDPFIRKITYPIAIIILALFAAPMAYGLLGVVGIFLLLPAATARGR